jgi:hypothetical protein
MKMKGIRSKQPIGPGRSFVVAAQQEGLAQEKHGKHLDLKPGWWGERYRIMPVEMLY